MSQASKYLRKLSQKLFTNESEQSCFEKNILEGKASTQSVIWIIDRPSPLPFEVFDALENQPLFVDRLKPGSRPGQSSLHEKGYFYILDYASVLMALPLLEITEKISTIVDVCASPGGKSVFAYRALQPQVLISNEVIGKRCGALVSNLKRLNIPSFVTSLDSEVLVQNLERSVDLAIVDAPCSGQSLLAKGEEAPGCFHPANINKCMNRQRRIIANSSKLVRPGGYLLYCTCTYSPEENEELCDWFIKKFPNFSPLPVKSLEKYKTQLSDKNYYRFFPEPNKNAGGFTVLFQNKETGIANDFSLPENLVRWKFPI